MKSFFSIFKGSVKRGTDDELIEEAEKDYVELDTTEVESQNKKMIVRPFSLTDFTDVKPIIDSLREGNTIPIINIKQLKEKDMIELKRAVNKIKKVVDAIEGDIAGIGEDFIVATPSSAVVYRAREKKKEDEKQEEEDIGEDLELY